MHASASVLLVEDDADIRETLRTMLELDGYRVAEAENGRRALELLQAGARPSVILLDLMMPVMNGWQFREEQNRDPGLAAIPVVVISGDGRIAEKANGLGAAGCLRKPVDLDLLLATVARFAAREGAAPGLA